MSDAPTLTVDGPADDWLPRSHCKHGLDVHDPPCADLCDCGCYSTPVRCWVPVETLPFEYDVVRADDGDNSIVARPLRVGDTVTLAWWNEDSPHPVHDAVPFASATVAEIMVIDGRESPCPPTPRGAYVNAADELWVYDALGESLVARGATPGGYGIRLSNVEALT